MSHEVTPLHFQIVSQGSLADLHGVGFIQGSGPGARCGLDVQKEKERKGGG